MVVVEDAAMLPNRECPDLPFFCVCSPKPRFFSDRKKSLSVGSRAGGDREAKVHDFGFACARYNISTSCEGRLVGVVAYSHFLLLRILNHSGTTDGSPLNLRLQASAPGGSQSMVRLLHHRTRRNIKFIDCLLQSHLLR